MISTLLRTYVFTGNDGRDEPVCSLTKPSPCTGQAVFVEARTYAPLHASSRARTYRMYVCMWVLWQTTARLTAEAAHAKAVRFDAALDPLMEEFDGTKSKAAYTFCELALSSSGSPVRTYVSA
jgi:hypothetical protein